MLQDPEGEAMMKAVDHHNLIKTYQMTKDRTAHFVRRLAERGLSPQEFVIVSIEVDDPNGGPIVDILMPDADWKPIRDAGQIPFANGIVPKKFMVDALDIFYPTASEALRAFEGVAIVVIANGAAGVFSP